MCIATTILRLSARLLAADTATRALRDWCDERRIGDGPIQAVKRTLAGAARPADELLDWLLPGPEEWEGMRHRRVTLMRGGVALSDCDLWWLPGRLEPRMLAELADTSRPFGEVVADLRPTRRTVLEVRSPAGAPHVLEHHAIVVAGVVGPRRPIAATRELYRRELVGGPTAPSQGQAQRRPAAAPR